ncbi:hypothetical protein DFH06DRAFT_1130282 [Mycena polygramma]|nr:hypothetical protein DFH06DRAFT_1130282 [Mycena polygramma]
MFFNALFVLSALSFVAAIPQPDVFTVTRKIKVLTDVSPFIVTSTTVFQFTQVFCILEQISPNRGTKAEPDDHYCQPDRFRDLAGAVNEGTNEDSKRANLFLYSCETIPINRRSW